MGYNEYLKVLLDANNGLDVFESVFSITKNMIIIIMCAILIYSLVQCFLGYKARRLMVSVVTFALIGSLVYFIAFSFIIVNWEISLNVAKWIARFSGTICGGIGGVLIYFLNKVNFFNKLNIFMISFISTVIISIFLVENLIAGMMLGLFFGMWAIEYTKSTVIITTALSGGFLLSKIITIMCGFDKNFCIVAGFIIGCLGIYVQWYTNGKTFSGDVQSCEDSNWFKTKKSKSKIKTA